MTDYNEGLSCRSCGKLLPLTAPHELDMTPRLDAAFSICSYCSEVGVIENMRGTPSVREPTTAELFAFERDFGSFIRAFRQHRNRLPHGQEP